MEVFDLGRVLQTAEAIKGMRQQSVTERLRQQYMGAQEQRAVSQDQRAAAQEQRTATQFTQDQQIENTRLLNAASAEVAQNPQAMARWLPVLKQAGVFAADADPSSMTPEQLQAGAQQVFESTSKALSAYSQAAGAGNVQSTQILANGNIGYLTRNGQLIDTGQKAKEQLQLTTAGGAPAVVNLREGAYQQLTTPEDERAAKAAEAAAVRGAQEAAATAAIPERVRVETQAERAATAPQRAEKVRQITTGIDNTMRAIDSALADSSGWTAGFIGSMTNAVAGSPAYDLNKTLVTIKANIGFDRLQAMRDASPTGGALGQVAVQELEALQASIASLDQAQSPPALKRALRSVKTHYENWRDAVTEANADAAQQPSQPQGQTRRVRVDAEGNVVQ